MSKNNIEIKKEKAYLVCPYVSMEDSEYRAKELEQALLNLFCYFFR